MDARMTAHPATTLVQHHDALTNATVWAPPALIEDAERAFEEWVQNGGDDRWQAVRSAQEKLREAFS